MPRTGGLVAEPRAGEPLVALLVAALTDPGHLLLRERRHVVHAVAVGTDHDVLGPHGSSLGHEELDGGSMEVVRVRLLHHGRKAVAHGERRLAVALHALDGRGDPQLLPCLDDVHVEGVAREAGGQVPRFLTVVQERGVSPLSHVGELGFVARATPLGDAGPGLGERRVGREIVTYEAGDGLLQRLVGRVHVGVAGCAQLRALDRGPHDGREHRMARRALRHVGHGTVARMRRLMAADAGLEECRIRRLEGSARVHRVAVAALRREGRPRGVLRVGRPVAGRASIRDRRLGFHGVRVGVDGMARRARGGFVPDPDVVIGHILVAPHAGRGAPLERKGRITGEADVVAGQTRDRVRVGQRREPSRVHHAVAVAAHRGFTGELLGSRRPGSEGESQAEEERYTACPGHQSFRFPASWPARPPPA